MIINIPSGGGAALNFRVVGGTTAPSNPVENTIWVNTDIPITSWFFSAVEPAPAEPGMVWFQTGISATTPFNALKKNNITVYPNSCNQYVGGAWVNKTAQTYQGGAWGDWTRYLYNLGDECIGLTGGWTYMAKRMSSGANTSSANITCTKNANSIYFSNAGATGAILYSTNKIDLTGIRTINFEGTIANTNENTYTRFCIWSDFGTYWTDNIVAQQQAPANDFSLDVSALNGEYYIGFSDYAFGFGSVTMKKLYMER